MKLNIAAAPTGLLHVGQARLALAAWLTARRDGGQVTLVLDDADPAHARPEHEDGVRHDLDWLGLDWDAVVRQSERAARYAAAAERLRRAGRVYACFESEEELRAKRDRRQRRGESTVYDRAMLKLTAAQREAAEAGGKRPYWRFMLNDGTVQWDDLVLGRQQVKLTAHSDPVVMRADGTPLPIFAAAVDELEFRSTHLVRGAETATATGLQLDMIAALGGRPGALRVGHLPGLAEGGPRAKRPPALRSLRADGIEPAALAGYLARLGTADPPVAEPASLLTTRFELARVGQAPPRFDPAALLALNRRALGSLPFEAVRARLPPAATPAFWMAVRGSLDLLREARGWWEVVGGSIVPPLLEDDAETLQQALAALPEEPWDAATWSGWTAGLGSGAEQALRLALTGEDHGPALDTLLPLIGRARVTERLRLASA